MKTITYDNYNNLPRLGLEEGNKVKFLRQVVGYQTKVLTGIIVGFNFRSNIGIPKRYFPVAHIKAECEYGSELPYNHTLSLGELTKI